MSTYKVIQDVEAEDKLIGPLSLRQFIYAGISAICLYLCYFLSTHHAAFLTIVLIPVAFISGFFAFPWGRDQPTELWALAKIRFFLKPRRRVWDQDGVKELVTITAPKHVQVDYTNGLSQDEVHSRLQALAATIDSRGWAIKNANLTVSTQPTLVMGDPQSDRLVNPSSLPQPVSDVQISAADDILDEKNNAAASRVDSMISASSKAHRDKLLEEMRKKDAPTLPPPPKSAATAAAPQKPNDYWFLNQPAQPAGIPNNMVTFNTQVVTPATPSTSAPISDPVITSAVTPVQSTTSTPPQDEASIVAELDAKKQELPTTAYYNHLHTIQPLSAQQQASTPPAQSPDIPTAQPVAPQYKYNAVTPTTPSPGPVAPPAAAAVAAPVTPTQQAAILQLSRNDDLNVATLAREAERSAPQDEVVIKLH